MRTCNKQVSHHASDHRWWFVVLRPGVEAGRTRSDPQITRDFSTLSLTELAFTICELLDWRRPNGGLKSPECYDFLQTLHDRGWLPWLLPQPRKLRPRSTEWDERSDAQASLVGSIGDYLPVQLQLLDNRSEERR